MSEHQIFKIFLGEHATRAPYLGRFAASAAFSSSAPPSQIHLPPPMCPKSKHFLSPSVLHPLVVVYDLNKDMEAKLAKKTLENLQYISDVFQS